MASDPFDAIGRALGGPEAAMGAAAIAAGILRLATYSGPPRPMMAVLLDCVVMVITAGLVGELVLATTANLHLAFAVGGLTGLIGWEAVKTVANRRFSKGK